MAKSPNNLSRLEAELARHGLSVLGGLSLTETLCAKGEESFAGRAAILIGNTGHRMWPYILKSPEYSDGQSDPMNRWTRRVVSKLTQHVDGDARYPFNIPYWPFQRIALATGNMHSSPLGILIHPEYGLWHAFRAVIIVSPNSGLSADIEEMIHQTQKVIHPCDTCAEKPCLNTCPVSAFDGVSLDREACFKYLDDGREPDCMNVGCAARNACPVGQDYKYENTQVRFHMRSYRGAF